AITNFLTKAKPIPANLRRLMRTIPEFAVRSGTTTRELALHVLQTSKNVINCRFHNEKHNLKSDVDGPTSGKYSIVGISFTQGFKKIEDGVLTCGCDIDTGLLEFLWWKTWMVRSGNPAVQEPETMKGDVLDPRHRAFFIQAFAKATLLSLNDLYSGLDDTFGTATYIRRVALLQAGRLVGMANMLLGPQGEQLVIAKEMDVASEPADMAMM
ncbi:hypothetical protein DFH07DRAFT_728621, partial [Mycena maculata]